jgi:hypothetical protein
MEFYTLISFKTKVGFFSSREKRQCWGYLNEWFSKGMAFGLK